MIIVTNKRIEEVKAELGLDFGPDVMREVMTIDPIGSEEWEILYNAVKSAETPERWAELLYVASRFNVGFYGLLQHVNREVGLGAVKPPPRASWAVLEAPRAIVEYGVG